jgi:hypothetical protein
MKPLTLIVILFISLNACRQESEIEKQDKLFKQDGMKVLAEIKDMLLADQQIRNFLIYGTSDTNEISRIISDYKKQGKDIERMVLINDTIFISGKKKDSIEMAMTKQDEKHTKRVLEIIATYGYPSSDRIDSSIKIHPFLLLHHPSLKYKDEILSSINKELRIGRMDTISWAMIKWDLNGREGIPEIPSMKATKNADGTTTLQF